MTATLDAGVEHSRSRPRSLRPALAVSALLTALIVGGGAVGGAMAVRGASAPGEVGVRAGLEGAEGFGEVFVAIVTLNLPVAASLVAGIVSVGAVTAVTGLMLGLYLGSTVGAAVNTVGAGELWDSVSAYAGLEMLGLALAAVAGFLPLSSMLAGRHDSGGGPLARYVGSFPLAAALAGGSSLLLLGAAAIEAAVIASTA